MEIWYVVLEYNKENELLYVKITPTPLPSQAVLLNTRPLLFKTAFDLARGYAESKNVNIKGTIYK